MLYSRDAHSTDLSLLILNTIKLLYRCLLAFLIKTICQLYMKLYHCYFTLIIQHACYTNIVLCRFDVASSGDINVSASSEKEKPAVDN